jgi:HlyD family secretion protein
VALGPPKVRALSDTDAKAFIMRVFLTILLVAGLAAGGWFGYQYWTDQQAAATAAPTYETTAVARGAIASTVSATGSIEPEAEVNLLFRSAGPVARVYVGTGDLVEAGQLLAELETTELTLALAQSKVQAEIAAAQLDKLLTPPDPMDVAAAQAAIEVAQTAVASAEAALASARAGYSDLFSDPTAAQQTVNEANLRNAEITLRQATQAYNKVKDNPDVGMLPQSQQLEAATVAYETAKAQAALTDQDATSAQVAQGLNQIAQAQSGIRQAQANVVNAQNQLDQLLDGPSEEDIRITQAQVKQAQLSVLQAENALANAQLVAPFAGVVSEVNVKEGELSSGGGLGAVRLTNIDTFHLDVLVDEVDVRQVAVGQTVSLSVDALPDAEITGIVTKISPTASNVNGVIAYEVTIVPDVVEAPLRVGMSATAIITTANVDDAVLVPNRYISLNRDTDQAFVYKLVAGEPVLQEIELGLRNERSSQVLGGLTDGDTLALITTSSEEALRGALFGGGN